MNRKRNKRILAGIIHFIMIGVLGAGLYPITANAEGEKLTGKTAMEITGMMGKGWNLGNTFDANGGNKNDIYSQEQSWGNPKVTKELIDGVKAAGFKTIRIPVTWDLHISKSEDYKIDDAFMARINEIVDYAYENDLFVIINLHHEPWVNDKDIDRNYLKIGEELVAVWTQIADRFADYDQHLLFEGMNEPRATGTNYEWSGTSECYDAVNYLNQLFVDCIRNNGKGQNHERALLIPGYAASSSPGILKSIRIPEINGKQAENVIVSVHCYSPYAFCLSDDQTTFNPQNPQDTGEITTLMTNLNQLFLSKEIPVVIGECGATNSNDNNDARKAWFTYIGEITEKNKIPAIVWDNGVKGNSGGECHNYFERKTGEMYAPELISSFIYGDMEAKKAKDIVIDFEPYKEGGATVLATPAQYGFVPANMTKMAKINHTEGAAVGFSAVVAKNGEDSYATMDVSKFAGKTINVTLFLQSKSSDSVTVGVIDSESVDIITTDIDTDWTQVTFSCKFSEDERERRIFFRGAGADDFYLDDISITMVDDKEMAEPFAGKEKDEEQQSAERNGQKEESTESASEIENEKDSTYENEDSETPGNGVSGMIAGILAAILILAVISIGMVKKRKKK